MSLDTAELAITDRPRGRARALRWWARLGADEGRMTAVRESWRALWLSRLLVWIAGAGTVATLGFGPARKAFDPPGITRGFGWLGDLLAAPAARWDSAWYLVIAHYGYRPDLAPYTSVRDAFFPLYPLGVRTLSDLGLQAVLAGVLLSLVAFAGALYGIHRLCTLELARGRWRVPAGREGEIARLAVLAMALAPMAFFFSAVYSESLYLALSVGLFWCARHGRWAWVGVLGALATMTRSAGLVLALPALMLYLYGPREDRPPDFEPQRGSHGIAGDRASGPPFARHGLGTAARMLGSAVRPRYRLRMSIAWLMLIPVGLLAYMAYLSLLGGDPLAPLSAQSDWGRHFAGPYVGVWDGVKAGLQGAGQLLSGQSAHLYYPAAAGSPMIAAGHNLMLLAFLLAAAPLLVVALRVLPLAYGVYTLTALALPLSYPVAAQPLMSLPRFALVLFPLGIALAVWLAAHPRMRVPVLVASALLMACFTAQFATWHWVA
jgi:Mannosyltransferase (PIG-V)